MNQKNRLSLTVAALITPFLFLFFIQDKITNSNLPLVLIFIVFMAILLVLAPKFLLRAPRQMLNDTEEYQGSIQKKQNSPKPEGEHSKEEQGKINSISFSETFLINRAYRVIFIPLSIYIIKSLELVLSTIQMYSITNGYNFLFNVDFGSRSLILEDITSLITPFYGILASFLLITGIFKFNKIDNLLSKEAKSVEKLNECLRFLNKNKKTIKDSINQILIDYLKHVQDHMQDEYFEQGIKERGDAILRKISKQFEILIKPTKSSITEPEYLIEKAISSLDEIRDIREERIALSQYRLFDITQIIFLLSTIILLTPYYINGFSSTSSFFDNFFTFGLTLILILIYIITDDLESLFEGIWHINPQAFQNTIVIISEEIE